MVKQTKAIKVNDLVYGSEIISEPVLIELIQSTPMQRLKNISQFGIPDKYFSYKGYDRFEHSVGVYILLKRLGAPMEEQIAGLLHDVSHFAFSHIADWIFADGRNGIENHHDENHYHFIEQTEIPGILIKYGFDPAYILTDSNFPLLEKNTPDLCVDRIDYALREIVRYENKEIVTSTLKSLAVLNKGIVFNDFKAAKSFAETFLHRSILNWSSKESTIRCHLFSSAFELAIKDNLVSEIDFVSKSENELMDILENSVNQKIQSILKILIDGKLERPIKDRIRIFKKFRYVDPYIVTTNNDVRRLSELDAKFAQVIQREKEKFSQGYLV